MKNGRKVSAKAAGAPTALAAAVYAIRVSNGWSQADFAAKIGHNVKMVTEIERGMRPSFRTLLEIGQYAEGAERAAVIEELRAMAPEAAWEMVREVALGPAV
jgi:transcriptional regulator with XRE-family HTH domain